MFCKASSAVCTCFNVVPRCANAAEDVRYDWERLLTRPNMYFLRFIHIVPYNHYGLTLSGQAWPVGVVQEQPLIVRDPSCTSCHALEEEAASVFPACSWPVPCHWKTPQAPAQLNLYTSKARDARTRGRKLGRSSIISRHLEISWKSSCIIYEEATLGNSRRLSLKTS